MTLEQKIQLTKNNIKATATANQAIFAAYKKAKTEMDKDIALLRSLEEEKSKLKSNARKEKRTKDITAKIAAINAFDWNTALDSEKSEATPPNLKSLLKGTIATAESYNVYTNQRQITFRVNRATTNIELLIAKTIAEKIKNCPIPQNEKNIAPTIAISTPEFREYAVYIDQAWHIRYADRNNSKPFKSLDHLLNMTRTSAVKMCR